MNISRVFIERPVLTTLIMVALVLFGLFGYATLPVSELPAVDFPTISVNASLPGADPETMASAVATPLESQFSTIPGVSSMTSSSASGKTSITIQFDLDRDIDAASEDVLAAIQQASRQLPVNMPSPPTLRKVNPADAPIMFLAMQSDSMPLYELDKYAENLLARQLSTLSGVAQVNVQGSQIFAVRLQVDPAQLAARNIGIDQVASAVQQANVNVATGTMNGPSQATLVHVNGQLMNAESWKHQIIAWRGGAPVRFAGPKTTIFIVPPSPNFRRQRPRCRAASRGAAANALTAARGNGKVARKIGSLCRRRSQMAHIARTIKAGGNRTSQT